MSLSPFSRLRVRDYLAPVLTGAVAVLGLIALVIWLWPELPEPPKAERVIQMVRVEDPTPIPPPIEPVPEEVKETEVPKPDPVVPIDQPKPLPDKSDKAPSEFPSEAPPTPSKQAAGLDRPADAGSDNYRLAAGKGGGLFGRGGGGGGGGDWDAAVALHITRALQRDRRTRSARGSLRVAVVIEANGSFSAARLVSSTGKPEVDAAIRAVLNNLAPMGRPRPAGIGASTSLMIDLKRSDG